jgi:hypothetical protein
MFVLEIDAAAVDYNLGHLRGSGIIEIDKWFSVYSLTQHREICADAVDVPPSGKPRSHGRITN